MTSGLAAPEPAPARLRLPPLVARGQPTRLAGAPHALGVRVPSRRVVALGEEQDVVAHRREPAAAERTGVGRRLEVLRAPELPPARLGIHFVTVVIVPVVLVVVVVSVVEVTVVAVGPIVPTGQSTPVLDFSTRQLRTTVDPVRLQAALTMSLDTRAR